MYEMAIGQVPFFEERVNKLIMKILKEEINFNKKQFNQYSMEFMDVLRKLLEKDPDKRPSWGEIENYPFWGLNYNNNPAPSARRRQNSNLDNSYFSLNNSDINNNSALNENSLRQIKKHESSSSSTNLHMNLNKNSEVKNFDINYEGEYDNNGDKNDKEVNINIDNNNANNFQNDEENSNYTNAKFKHLLNKNNSNDLSMSLLKINKLGDKKEKMKSLIF